MEMDVAVAVAAAAAAAAVVEAAVRVAGWRKLGENYDRYTMDVVVAAAGLLLSWPLTLPC